MSGTRDTNVIMKLLVRPWVYRHHPKAWGAACMAAGAWLFILGGILSSGGFWWGALLIAVAALGRSRARPAEITVLAVAWVAVYVFQGALYHAGASHAIVYGLYPATAPLMIVGLVGAGAAAARGNWPVFGAALTVAVIATGAAFAGPVDAWLIMGAGLFAALLGHAAVTAWRQRA